MIDSINYNSAEQNMMAEKAYLFGDKEIRDRILTSKYPKQAKDLGRQVRGFQKNIWNEHYFIIVKKEITKNLSKILN